MLKKLFRQKLFKFLIGGGVAAVINLLLIFGLIELLGFNTPALRMSLMQRQSNCRC